MTILVSLLKEIVGMFLADGRLPVWLIGWIAIVGIVAYAGAPDLWRGVLLLGGFVAILAVNVLMAARTARSAADGSRQR